MPNGNDLGRTMFSSGVAMRKWYLTACGDWWSSKILDDIIFVGEWSGKMVWNWLLVNNNPTASIAVKTKLTILYEELIGATPSFVRSTISRILGKCDFQELHFPETLMCQSSCFTCRHLSAAVHTARQDDRQCFDNTSLWQNLLIYC
jgi:hypothetical protein